MISLTPAFKSFRLHIIKAAHQKYLDTHQPKAKVHINVDDTGSPSEEILFTDLQLSQQEKEMCGIF